MDIYKMTLKTINLNKFKKYSFKTPKDSKEIINLMKEVRLKINQLCNK